MKTGFNRFNDGNATFEVRTSWMESEQLGLVKMALALVAKECGWYGPVDSIAMESMSYIQYKGTPTTEEMRVVADRFRCLLQEVAEITREYEVVVREKAPALR